MSKRLADYVDELSPENDGTLYAVLDGVSKRIPAGTFGGGGGGGEVPNASTTVAGKVELATVGEAIAGTDNTRAITPLTLAAALEASGVKFARGMTADGSTDDKTPLQNSLDATPTGGLCVIPGGAYGLASGLEVPPGVLVMAYGAQFVRSGDFAAMTFAGSYDTPIAVSNVSVGSQTIDEVTQPVTTLTLGSSPSWAKGDIVKLYADDVIPDARPGNGTNEARLGHYLTVAAVSGTTVHCYGVVTDTFSTNVKVARLGSGAPSGLLGGRFASTDATIASSASASMIRFQSLAYPLAQDARIESSPAVGILFRGCYGYRCDSAIVDYAKNAPSTGQYGYGVEDVGCAYGVVSNLRARRPRSAFTTDSAQIAASSSPDLYGRTYGTLVTDSVSVAAAAAGFSTHLGAQHVTFDTLKAFDGGYAVNLRGIGHTVRNIDGYRNNQATIAVFTEDGGDSYGHAIENVRSYEPNADALEIIIHPAGHPNEGVRHAKRTATIRGFEVVGASRRSVRIDNADVVIDDLRIEYADGALSSSHAIEATNSTVHGRDWSHDCRYVAAAQTDLISSLVRLEGSSDLTVDGWRYETTDDGEDAVTRAIGGTGPGVVDVRRFTLSHAPRSAFSVALTGATLDYLVESTGANPAYVALAGANITEANLAAIARSLAPRIIVRVSPGSNMNCPTLPDGRVLGQELLIWNVSVANTFTVEHGGNVDTIGNSNKTLSFDQTCPMVWNGSAWQQIAEI